MKLSRKIKSLITLGAVFLFLFGAGVVIKNVLLGQVKKQISSTFNYSNLHLSVFPPALIVEGARSISLNPFFSARKVVIGISLRALLTRNKPLEIFFENPILRMNTSSSGDKPGDKRSWDFSFPFPIEKGLIRDGEFYIWGRNVNLQSRGLRAVFRQSKDTFFLQAESDVNIFSLPQLSQPLEGELSLFIEGNQDNIIVRKFLANGSDVIVKAKGRIKDLLDPEFDLQTSINIKTGLLAEFLDLPFVWRGKASGDGILSRKSGLLAFSSDFSSRDLVLSGVPLEQVKGKVKVNFGQEGSVEFNIWEGAFPSQFVRLFFSDGRIDGTARGVFLEPVMNDIDVPWPVASPVWGNFSLQNGRLHVEAELRDDYVKEEPGKYVFEGDVKLDWDGRDHISIFSKRLRSHFADAAVEADIYLDKKLDVTINGETSDVDGARDFTSLLLDKKFDFPEIRGRGLSDVSIKGDYKKPKIRFDFDLSPGGFDFFDAQKVKGWAVVENDVFSGRIQIEDSSMKGDLDIRVEENYVQAEMRLDRGKVDEIFPALGIDFPLRGDAAGRFAVLYEEDKLKVEGDFSSENLYFLDQKMSRAMGTLTWENGLLQLENLDLSLYEGKIKGYIRIDLSSREFDIDLSGEQLELSSLYSGITGTVFFDLKGKGNFEQDLCLGRFEVNNLHHDPLQMMDSGGEISLALKENRLKIRLNGFFQPGENELYLGFFVPLSGPGTLIEARGVFRNLDLLLPWKGAEGELNYRAEIKENSGKPQLKGILDFRGEVLPLHRFAHAVRNYSGLAFVNNGTISIRSFQGQLGGGDIHASGELRLGREGLEKADIKLEGEKMLLAPLERTRALTDGTLNLVREDSRFVLNGDFVFHQLSWRREVNEKFEFYSTPDFQETASSGFFDNLNLNIRLRALDNAWMENSLGRIRGRFDLTLSGSVKSPIVLGEIEALGGDVDFQDREFKILTGRINFFNPSSTEPHLNFKGETFVKDYRVTFSLNGPLEKLTPEFSSSPPLPPEDVLALLALGESFKRTYSYDTSTRQSTASLLSFQLAEEATDRAERLFSIDRFRIEPFVMGSSAEMTARLTLGKKISKNFFILYSTNLATQRDDITRLEWELTDDISIVGTRNEEGRVSIDVKIHKRF
ncbi:MAG: translocation/assembly module TamB domain-containing protein [Candidatus Aminicenantes bacterium]|nr:translocation/assembly module TamB domain-containing protein [Candidatus Aminicenantes bacterium]